MRFADIDKKEKKQNHQFFPLKPKHAYAKNAGRYLWHTEKTCFVLVAAHRGVDTSKCTHLNLHVKQILIGFTGLGLQAV